MSKKKISTGKLESAIKDILDDYSESVNDKVKKSVDDVSKELVADLKANSPKRTGNYRKAWSRKKEVSTSSKTAFIVHNSEHYRLTHLLEKGHAKSGGGRTKAIPHIAPAEERAISKLEKRIKEDLK